MISTRIPKRLLGSSAIVAATVIAGVGLVPTLAAAQGDAGPQGHLIVEKAVEGESAAAAFGFHVTCDDGFDRTFTLAANTSKEFDGIWEGAVCVVTETDDGDATSTTVTPDNGTVVIRDNGGDAGTATVAFVNVFVPPTTTTSSTTTTSTSTTTTTAAPTLAAVTTTTTLPTVVLGVTLTAPPEVAPAELPRTGSSTVPTLVVVGLALTAFGIALRRKAARTASV